MTNFAQRIAVVGGGTAGLSAALALADCGFPVTLIERSAELGGHAAEWACMATTECAKCNACVIKDMAKRVKRHPDIDVSTGFELKSVTGSVGDFRVQAEPVDTAGNGHDRSPLEIVAGSVVLATGFTPYDATADPMLGYGLFPGVVTTIDVDAILLRDDIESFLPSGIERPRVAFIQCVGSRDVKRHREYCSQFCCKTSVRLARRLKYLTPNAEITIFYIDLQVMGKEFRGFFEEAQSSIDFIQGTPAEVTPLGPDGPYRVYASDPETRQTTAREFDRVILAVGVDHAQANDALAETLGLDTDELGFFLELGDRSPRPGIYLAGACTGPMDMRGAVTRGQSVAAAIRRDRIGGETQRIAQVRALHQLARF